MTFKPISDKITFDDLYNSPKLSKRLNTWVQTSCMYQRRGGCKGLLRFGVWTGVLGADAEVLGTPIAHGDHGDGGGTYPGRGSAAG